MVEIPQYLGEFGNRMFQYAYGAILACRAGVGLTCGSPDPCLENAKSITGKRGDGWVKVDDSNCVEVFENATFSTYHLWGFFQKYQFYKNYKELCKVFFEVPESKLTVSDNSVVVHIRRGDYAESKNRIHISYYLKILKTQKFSQVYVIGRGIDKEVRAMLDPYHPIFTNLPHADDYALLLKAPNIIMSNSTFAWWGAWLGKARTIWYPITKYGCFSETHAHQSLKVDESRYIYVPEVEVF